MKRFALTACFIFIFLASVSFVSAAKISAVSEPVSSVETAAIPDVLLPLPNVHTFVSEKPYYLRDGETGMWYDHVKGNITMSWQDKTRDGFFEAKVYAVSPITDVVEKYTFSLVAVGNCTYDCLEGIWDITRNGVLVCSGCAGKAYGINAPVGDYFKLYIGDDFGDDLCYGEKWHLSGFVTYRKDF